MCHLPFSVSLNFMGVSNMSEKAFTVGDLLQLPVLAQAKLVSGAGGIHNEVYYVDIMEIPDLAGWLRPHEFVLTTGYSFQDNPMVLCRLLEEMKNVGGAAVGIKSRRYLQGIPEEALQKSNEYNIPILEIPPEITYIDITHSVMENIFNHQLVLLRKVSDLSHQFTNLVLNRRASELVVMIGKLLGCEAAVVNREGELESATPLFQNEDVVYKRNVQVGSYVAGRLLLTCDIQGDNLFAKMCLDQAVTVLALEFTIRDSIQQRKEQEREDFLMELLSGTTRSEEVLMYRAKQLNFPMGRQQYVVLIHLHSPTETLLEYQSESWEHDRNVILNEVRRGKQNRVAMTIGDQIAVACVSSRQDASSLQEEVLEWAEQLYASLKQQLPTVELYFGIGSACNQLSALAGSHIQAKRAIEAGRRVRPDRHIILYRDIYVEDMMLSLGAHPALKTLYQTLLLPIHTYDLENGTDLSKTLDSYVRHGGNTKKVAEELYVHRNSVNYRLERVQSILETDLNDAEMRLRLELVLRAWKLGLLETEA